MADDSLMMVQQIRNALSLPSPALPLLAKKHPLSLPDSSGVFITQIGEGEGKTQSLIGFPLQIAGATYWLRIRQSGESRGRCCPAGSVGSNSLALRAEGRKDFRASIKQVNHGNRGN